MELKGVIWDWDFASSRVYPVLLHTDSRKAFPGEVISAGIMDLSIGYAVREKMETGGYMAIRVTEDLLKSYGVSREELHKRAMENLKEDGYALVDLEQCLLWMVDGVEGSEPQPVQGGLQEGRMYILKNASGMYGAAGILDAGLLRSVAGGKDCVILPSSIHETILFPAVGWEGKKEALNSMVTEINATQVREDERLSDHSYYYDAQEGKLRIWA